MYVSVIGCGCRRHVFGFMLLGLTHFSGAALSTESACRSLKRTGASFLSQLLQILCCPPLSQSHLSASSSSFLSLFSASSESKRHISSNVLTPLQVLRKEPDGFCSTSNS